MLRAGFTLHGGRFRLLSLLRRGEASEVWRAWDDRAGREVALKALPVGAGGAAAAEAEAEAAARVRHAGILAVHGTFAEGEYGFIAMDLAHGNVADLLDRWGPLEPAAARAVGRAVAEALAAAHAAGVVHRDVKPENVLVMPDGSVRLADFGVAQVAARGSTRTGAIVGTLASMAPEQRADPRAVRPATDVYAWAVLLARLRTGAVPGELYVPAAQDALRAALRAAGEADDALWALLIDCGRYAPEQRLADGAALVARCAAEWGATPPPALRVAGWDAPAEGPPPPDAGAPAPPPARTRGGAAAVGLALVAGVGAGWALGARGPAPAPDPALAAAADWLAVPPCPDAVPLGPARRYPRAAADTPTPGEAHAATVADLDGDGHADMLVSHQRGAVVRVWWGPLPAEGWFDAFTDLPTGRASGPAVVGDFDGDGHADIAHVAAENGGLAVLPMRGRAPAAPLATIEQGTEPRGLAAVDWDRDGRDDLLVLARDGDLLWRRSAADGFAPPVALAAGVDALAPGRPGEAIVWRGGGLAALASGAPARPRATLPLGPRARLLPIADGVVLAGDGPLGPALARLPADGPPCRLPPADPPPHAIADLDGDGLPDAVHTETCTYCSSAYTVRRGAR